MKTLLIKKAFNSVIDSINGISVQEVTIETVLATIKKVAKYEEMVVNAVFDFIESNPKAVDSFLSTLTQEDIEAAHASLNRLESYNPEWKNGKLTIRFDADVSSLKEVA